MGGRWGDGSGGYSRCRLEDNCDGGSDGDSQRSLQSDLERSSRFHSDCNVLYYPRCDPHCYPRRRRGDYSQFRPQDSGRWDMGGSLPGSLLHRTDRCIAHRSADYPEWSAGGCGHRRSHRCRLSRRPRSSRRGSDRFHPDRGQSSSRSCSTSCAADCGSGATG
jgi:hypothetical protein